MFLYVPTLGTREEEQKAYGRCKTARQTDLRVMLAGPKGREVGESGELDTVILCSNPGVVLLPAAQAKQGSASAPVTPTTAKKADPKPVPKTDGKPAKQSGPVQGANDKYASNAL
eukprot:1184995-Prorocentrum_minimum.AAC.1